MESPNDARWRAWVEMLDLEDMSTQDLTELQAKLLSLSTDIDIELERRMTVRVPIERGS